MGVVMPSELDEEDLVYLHAAIQTDPLGLDLMTVVDQAIAGVAQIWKVVSPKGRGIMVTQIEESRDGRSMFVWLLGGEMILPYMRTFMDRLEDHARDLGCRWITAQASERLAKVYEKGLDFEPVSVRLIKEV